MLAGAYYGLEKDLLELYKFVRKWDNLDFAIKAYKLFNKKPIK